MLCPRGRWANGEPFERRIGRDPTLERRRHAENRAEACSQRYYGYVTAGFNSLLLLGRVDQIPSVKIEL